MIRAVIALLVLASVVIVGGCKSDWSGGTPCSGIPDGGCPLSHGVACDDPSCVAVYACFGGEWSLDHLCPAREAGSLADAGSADDASDGSDSASSSEAGIDAPPGAFGGPGCPDLEPPDCPLGVALDCPNGCCGCEDLFVCQNGGWSAWGTCGDAGVQRGARVH